MSFIMYIRTILKRSETQGSNRNSRIDFALFADVFRLFFVKFASQNFPSVITFVFRKTTKFLFKACVRCILSNFYFSPNDSPSKTVKMFFISSKKLFRFSRYSNICIFRSSFPLFPDSKGQTEME